MRLYTAIFHARNWQLERSKKSETAKDTWLEKRHRRLGAVWAANHAAQTNPGTALTTRAAPELGGEPVSRCKPEKITKAAPAYSGKFFISLWFPRLHPQFNIVADTSGINYISLRQRQTDTCPFRSWCHQTRTYLVCSFERIKQSELNLIS